MAVVDLNIGSREFQLACNDGEEAKLKSLGEKLNQRLKEFNKLYETSNDNLLLLMTALMMQEEINELEKNPRKSENNNAVSENSKNFVSQISERLELITNKIENLAEQLEKR